MRLCMAFVFVAAAAAFRGVAAGPMTFPPSLPDGAPFVSDRSDAFLKPLAPLKGGVTIAKVPPTVDFAFVPGQDYRGNPWSAWGDSLCANGKYYFSAGDHLALGGKGDVSPERSGNA